MLNLGLGQKWVVELNHDDRNIKAYTSPCSSDQEIRIQHNFPKIRRKFDKDGNVTKAQVWHTASKQWMNLTNLNYGREEWVDKHIHRTACDEEDASLATVAMPEVPLDPESPTDRPKKAA